MSFNDRYEILRTLGLGSLGRVDLVNDRQAGEQRALKRLQAADPETVERLRNEFAALARLRHPRLVQVFDLGQDATGDPFLTMEFLDGEPLDRAIAPGDVPAALRAALEILDGLEFLHANGYAHCDVKPGNVLLGRDGSIRIIDLGFVAHLGEQPGSRVRGTPGYLAPEVRTGGAYTRESDLYALGATLYRVLAGRAAFPGRDAAEIVEAQDRGKVALGPLRAMNVPPALDAPLLGLLSLDPRHRAAAARDLRALAQARIARGMSGPDVLHAAGRLLGRDAIVTELREALRSTGAAVIFGRRGAGKSRLALELQVEAELAGRPLVRLDPSSRSFEIPPRALIVLEDLDQWSDEALARVDLRAAGEGWFLLVTQRAAPRDGDPVFRLLFRLENPPAPRLVSLSSLDADAARRMAEERIGGRLAESIHQQLWTRSAGWPGPLLVELDRIVRAGLIAREGDVWKETGTIDPGAAADLDDEGSALLESLTSDARLAGAMIAGYPLGIEDVSPSGLDDLEWAGHLVWDDDSPYIVPPGLARALRSDPQLEPRVRELLVERLSGARDVRSLLARGAHEAVLCRSSAATTLFDAFKSGLREDVRIADEASELLLPLASTEVLLSVARTWRERGDTLRADRVWTHLRSVIPEQAGLVLEHAQMLSNVMQFDRAREVLESIERSTDGPILGLHGWCLARTGRREEGLAEMRRALDILPESDAKTRAMFHSRLGVSLYLGGQVELGIAHLDESVRDLGILNDPELEARLHGNLGLRFRIEGQLIRAQAENRLALELTRASGRPEHVPTALANLLSTSMDLCDWPSWDHFQNMLEDTSRESGNAIAFGRSFEGRATLGILRGRTKDAARALALIRPWFTKERSEEFFLFSEIMRSVIGSWRGEFDRAIRRMRRVRRRAKALKLVSIEVTASRHLAEVLLVMNQLKSSRSHAEFVLNKRPGEVDAAIPCLLILARIALREEDSNLLETLESRIRSSDAPVLIPARQEIAAYRALLGGDAQSAKQLVRAAIDGLRELDLATYQALLQWEFGKALLARNDPDASSYLQDAREIARRCDMLGWAGRIAESSGADLVISSSTPSGMGFESRLLPKVIALLNSVLEFPVLLNQSLELAATEIGASRGFILLAGQSEFELTAVAQFGGVDDGARASALEVSRTIVRRVTETGVPFIAGDVGSDPRLGSTHSLLDMAVRSLICVPLGGKSGIIGTIYLESKASGTQFTVADLDLVEAFAGLISVAIESGRLHDELKRSRERLVGQNLSLRRDVTRRFSRTNIIGQSPEIVAVVGDAERVAVARSNVLITGETGTGKELVAKLIHYSSPRSDQACVSLNCAAFPADLIEAELFGIADRVATNVRARPGIFEQANGGTLFLDEIGELPLFVQAKLLRVLQEREFAPIGSGKVKPVDFRLISATNQDVQGLMDRGLFRPDLFHRIHTLRIHIPPLRERKIDILLLANYFLEKFCEENGRPLPTISAQLKSVLLQSGWPGNVRELQNYVERLAVMCQGPVLEPIFVPTDMEKRPGIAARTLGPSIEHPNETARDLTHRSALEDFERARIVRALEETGGNQRRAAELLGLKESTLRYILKKLELRPERRPSRGKTGG
jgi:Nif-specific regulatory protein